MLRTRPACAWPLVVAAVAGGQKPITGDWRREVVQVRLMRCPTARRARERPVDSLVKALVHPAHTVTPRFQADTATPTHPPASPPPAGSRPLCDNLGYIRQRIALDVIALILVARETAANR